jgi:hypothetical protein
VRAARKSESNGHHIGCHPERSEGSAVFLADKQIPRCAREDRKIGFFRQALDPEGGRHGCRPFSDETWMSRQKIRSNLNARLNPALIEEGTFFGYFLCASKESNSPAQRAKRPASPRAATQTANDHASSGRT